MPLLPIITSDDCCRGNVLSRRGRVHESGFSLGIPRLSRKAPKRENKTLRFQRAISSTEADSIDVAA